MSCIQIAFSEMGNEFYIFSTNHLQSAPAQTLKTVSQLNLIASNYSAASVPSIGVGKQNLGENELYKHMPAA